MKYSNSRRTNRAYASSAAKLDAVERRFARLFDAISYAIPSSSSACGLPA